MVYSKPLIILVLVVLLSFVQGWSVGDWILRKPTGVTLSNGIINQLNSGTPALSPDESVDINQYLSCFSLSKNGESWSLTADASNLISGSEYAFGFWVNFESTISPKVFQFGANTGPRFIVSSTENGTLKVSFFSSTTTNDPANDLSITVPLNKWFFIVFHFTNVSGTPTLKIILPGQPVISKTSGSSNVAFVIPSKVFFLEVELRVKFIGLCLQRVPP
ncbi:unnamed protein product [Blepharisma stoltei]|uniref:Lectin n=1 Tax=Blepharisma stoltei TaxID=1481888 RepID=A0AAU9K1N8_9CILI|nr:unnamed protein product [Blepharisma stoltei]